MNVKLISVGKTKAKYWQLAEADFKKRIQRYTNLVDVRVKDAGYDPDKQADRIKQIEAAEISKRIQTGDYVIATDLKGEHFSSQQFAEFLNNRILFGNSCFTFVVGGPLGLSESILTRADFRMALSKMTFVHEMARVILLEQIYRAFTILKGEKYHK